MNKDINEINTFEFINDWENKKKSYVKSTEIPKENNGDVLFIIVGDTFKDEIINNNKDIVILFYSPWCYHYTHCKALLPKYEEVAKILKPKNKNLILTKINAIYNEVESIDINDDYKGDKSVDDIIKFIKNNVAYPIYIDNEKDKNTEL